MRNYILLIIAGFVIACSSQQDGSSQLQSANKFNDTKNRKIAEWQDRRQLDSLLVAVDIFGEEYKKEIAMALASLQKPESVPVLTDLLKNDNPDIRKAAAFALGQVGDSSSFEPLFDRLQVEENQEVVELILEALGKTATAEHLEFIAAYNPINSRETTGLAKAIYRAGVRELRSLALTTLAANILDTAKEADSRLFAAHYLGRASTGALPSIAFEVLNQKFEEPEIRMAVATALGKSPPLVAVNGLRNLLTDNDYRVRVNAVRAIPNEKINQYYSFIDTLLFDVNPNVAVATAEKILLNTAWIDGAKIQEWRKKKPNWRAEALLMEAALSKDPENVSLLEEIKKAYQSARKPQHKAVLMNALSPGIQSYNFIITEMFRTDHPAISTAGIMALSKMRKSKNFPSALKPTFADVFIQAIKSGDPAMIDISAATLRDPDLQYKKEITDFSFLTKAKENLSLPRENETLQSLERTLAFFENREPEPVINKFNHPIDWDKIKDLKAEQEATIKTSKGDIRLILFTNEAPGSVSNFVTLARQGYFNNKVFHRVVPNFVVQGGGNRGDGWGGEDYSIRSEFSTRRYTTGSIGMASAGKDTEGTQWFITHSPTPHLDGRYTIFAHVIEGMEVVHKLEQGDIINRVTIN